MLRFTIFFVSMFFCLCTLVYGDTIILKNGDTKVEVLKVMGMTNKYLIVKLSKKDVKSLNKQFSHTKSFPDVIVLSMNNIAIDCKIIQIFKDTIQIIMPASLVASLNMTFPFDNTISKPNVDIQGLSEAKKTEQPKELIRAEPQHVEELIEQKGVLDGIRTQARDKSEIEKPYRIKTKVKNIPEKDSLSNDKIETRRSAYPTASESVTEEDQKELVDESANGEQVGESQDALVQPTPQESTEKGKPLVRNEKVGRIEGKVLHGGKPLKDCQIKLQMLEKGGMLMKVYHPIEGAEELETTTDVDGVYRFTNVPPGFYKLYWKPFTEASWVRRFKIEPDVIVELGKVTNPKEIETLKRTLN